MIAAMVIMSLFLVFLAVNQQLTESFSYKRCREQGFTMPFCLETPTASMTTGTCTCTDGTIGITQQSTGARCICNSEINRPWLRSDDPLVYDGSAKECSPSWTDDSEKIGRKPETNLSELNKHERQDKGRWWFRFQWV